MTNLEIRRSQDDVIKATLKWGRCSIFLGAGVSVSAGIPGVGAIIRDLAPIIRRSWGFSDTDNEKTSEEWLKDREKDLYGESLYAWALDTAIPIETERVQYFDALLSGKAPTPTHTTIAQLVDYGYVSMVLTTNFDRLMEYALFQTTRHMPCILLSNQVPEYLDTNSPRAKVFKLHGDYLYGNIRNLDHELYKVKESMAVKLALAAAEPLLIVAGYSGGDSSVMEVFQELAGISSNFRGGIYWLHLPGEQPKKEVVQLLSTLGYRDVGLVEVTNSDHFFAYLLSSITSKNSRSLDPLPNEPHHFLFDSQDAMSRFVHSRLDPLQAAEFLSLLKRRIDLAPFSESAASLDYLLARYEELCELPGNVGELVDRYIDLLSGGSSKKQSRYERRVEQAQRLGLIGEQPATSALWQPYLEALQLTETHFDLNQVDSMLADHEAYKVLNNAVGLVSDATGIIHSAVIAAVQGGGICGRIHPWPESMYRAAALCGAAARVDSTLVERIADWLSLELDKEEWIPDKAMSALSQMGSSVIEQMVAMLSDGLHDIFSREDAAIVLGGIGSRKVIDRLAQVGRDASPQSAKLLVYALGMTANPRAVDAIQQIAVRVPQSSDTFVQKSLRRLGYAGPIINASGPDEESPRRPHLNNQETLQRYAANAGDRSHIITVQAMYRKYGSALSQMIEKEGGPPDMKVLLGIGRQLRDVGRLFEAEIIVAECLDRYPMVPMCYHDLALIYSRQGRLHIARRYYAVGIGFNPHYSDYYNDFAVTMNRLGNMEAARSLLIAGLGLEFNNYRLWYNLADVNVVIAQKGPVEHQQEVAMPSGGLIYGRSSEIDLQKIFQFREAAVCLRRVLELNPHHPLAAEQLKKICLLTGESPDRRVTPQEVFDVLHVGQYKMVDPPAFEDLPDEAWAGIERFRNCWAQGDRDGALEGLRAANHACPHSTNIVHNLTILLSNMQLIDEAIELQKKALSREPGNLDLLLNYVTYLLRADKPQEAVAVAKCVIRTYPNSPVGWFLLAEAYQASDKIKAAREAARRAARLSPPWAWCMIRGKRILEELNIQDVLVLFGHPVSTNLPRE